MNIAKRTSNSENARRGRVLRTLRKIHGWLGLWGAVLGLLFGVSGFLLNHRAVMKIPALKMEESEVQLQMVQPYPQDQRAFVRYVQQAFDISQQPVKPKGKSESGTAGLNGNGAVKDATQSKRTQEQHTHEARFMGKGMQQPPVWKAEFHLPQANIKAEYIPGNQYARIERQDVNAWGFIMRMHKGLGANSAWVLLADTIAGAMVFLSITGVLLWTKMRGSRLAMVGLIGGSLIATILTTMSML